MKILFGVQGTGNGHISRSRTLARALKTAGADVDYIFSGRAPEDYFDMDEFGQYKTYQGVSFATQNGKINLRKTVKRIRAFRLLKDVHHLNLKPYDCIISDFEPVSAWAAYHQKRECIGISNQATCQYMQQKDYGIVANIIMKYYAPVTQAIGLHWFHFGYPLVPPMIDALSPLPVNKKIVVYLPFESIDEIVPFLAPFSQQYQFECYHPTVSQPSEVHNIALRPLGRDNFTQAVSSCSGIIANTGFALISEALVLGKKILTKPVSGQFEQLYNASCLNELDMASIMHTLDKRTLGHWLLLPSPAPVVYPNVAQELANWIVSGRKEPLIELSTRLWQQTIFPEHVVKKLKQRGYAV